MAVSLKYRLLLGVAAEFAASTYLTTVGLPSISGALAGAAGIAGLTGIGGTIIGIAGAAIIWNMGAKLATSRGPRLLAIAGNAPFKIARTVGTLTPSTTGRVRQIAALISPDRAMMPEQGLERRSANALNFVPLTDAAQDVANGKSTLTNLIVSEQDYRQFMDGMSERGIPVIDLDSEVEERKRMERRGFESPAIAFAEITRAADQNGGMTPELAEEIIERLVKTTAIAPEQRGKLLEYIDATLEPFARETENAKERLFDKRAQSEPVLALMDASIITRIRQNADIVEALEKTGLVRDMPEALRAINHHIERHGVDATLNVLKNEPEKLIQPNREMGSRETPERQTKNDAIALKKSPHIAEALEIYVRNISANSADAKKTRQIKEMRDGQSPADLRLDERDRALNRVRRRIERETLWIDPETKTTIMRESLAEIFKAQTPPGPQAEAKIVLSAGEKAKESLRPTTAAIVDISRMLHNADDLKNGNAQFQPLRDKVNGLLAASAYMAQTDNGKRLPIYAKEFEAKILPKIQKDITFQAQQAEIKQTELKRQNSQNRGREF